jgi:hypothetical protein
VGSSEVEPFQGGALASPSIGYRKWLFGSKEEAWQTPQNRPACKKATLEPDVHLTSPGRPSRGPHSWGGLLGKQRKKTSKRSASGLSNALGLLRALCYPKGSHPRADGSSKS